MKPDTNTLIDALRILARDIHSEDGVANAAINEAADKLEELQKLLDGMGVFQSVERFGSTSTREKKL